MATIKTFKTENDYSTALWIVNQLSEKQANGFGHESTCRLSTHRNPYALVHIKPSAIEDEKDFLMQDGFEMAINGKYITKKEFAELGEITKIVKFVADRFSK